MERIAAACSDYVASSSQMRVEQASKEGGKGKESGVGVGGARIEAIEKKKKKVMGKGNTSTLRGNGPSVLTAWAARSVMCQGMDRPLQQLSLHAEPLRVIPIATNYVERTTRPIYSAVN